MPATIATVTAAYHPLGQRGFFPVTVTSAVQTLGQLLATAGFAIPVISQPQGQVSRFPRHLIFQSTFNNADSIYMTWDGTDPQSAVNPVVGWEITPGGIVKLENAFDLLDNGSGVHSDNSTAFKFIADGDTFLQVIFSD